MRIIEKYLVKNFLGPLIFISLSFIVLYMVVDLFGHLDEIIRGHAGVFLVLKYYLNYLPLIFVQVLPFASLVAILYSLGHLQRYNEITAMYASGIGLWKIIAPYVATSLIMSVAVFIINEEINPVSYIKTREIKDIFEKNKKDKQTGLVNNVTLYGQGNRIIYARSYDLGKKVLYDLIILQHDDRQTLNSRITARLAIWQGSIWKLYGLVIYSLDSEGRFIGEPEYADEKEIELTNKPEDFLRQDFIAEAMNSKELRGYISKFKGGSDKIIRKLAVELNYKKSYPFSTLVLTLIAIPFALMRNISGKTMSLGAAFGTGLLFYGINAISLGLGKIGVIPSIVAAWIVPVMFTFIGAFLIRRNPH